MSTPVSRTREASDADHRPAGGPPERRPRTAALRQNRAGLAFVGPTFVVVFVVVIVPVLWTVLLAFQRARLVDIQGMGLFGDRSLRNFTHVFTSPGLFSSLLTTLLYTVGGTAGSVVLGLIAALALRRPFRGRGLLRGAMLLPYVAPVVGGHLRVAGRAQPAVRHRERVGCPAVRLGRSHRLPVHP